MAASLRIRGLVVVALMLAAGLGSQSRAADALQLSADGWHSWRVASVAESGEETIFVLIHSGQAREIEIAGHWCNSRRHEKTVDHGLLNADDSIDWLQQFLGTRSELRSDALAAISRHDGERALQILIDIVESDAAEDFRQEAVFWMAMSESNEAFAYIDRLLMAD